MSEYLVWMDYKGLGYRGLETVVVTREEVNIMGLTVLRVWLFMMMRGYRYLVYRGLVNCDKGGGEHVGGWRSWGGLYDGVIMWE